MSTLAYLFPLTMFSIAFATASLDHIAKGLDEAEAQRIEKKLKG